MVRGKGPGLFEVVDLVFYVGGRPAGLDGGEIDAVDLLGVMLDLVLITDSGESLPYLCVGVFVRWI